MTDFGLVRYLYWEKDGDGIWEVDFASRSPIPPGSDGGIGKFRREREAAKAVKDEEPTP